MEMSAIWLWGSCFLISHQNGLLPKKKQNNSNHWWIQEYETFVDAEGVKIIAFTMENSMEIEMQR